MPEANPPEQHRPNDRGLRPCRHCRALLAAAGAPGKSLEEWLRDDFFAQHCRLFHNRPFLWHIWDGRKDGFSALINYHKLDAARLDKLIYTYLGDWIRFQRARRDHGEPGADGRWLAALELEKKLKAIREGEPPYDIYVRWKPLRGQPLGWQPAGVNRAPWPGPPHRPDVLAGGQAGRPGNAGDGHASGSGALRPY